jgi:hypothetical protein
LGRTFFGRLKQLFEFALERFDNISKLIWVDVFFGRAVIRARQISRCAEIAT